MIDFLSGEGKFCWWINAMSNWEGSAFRSHPRGIIDEMFKFTNNWHTHDYCSISVAKEGWMRNQSQNSCGSGNPHPRPKNEADEHCIWSNGKWTSDKNKERFEGVVRKILARRFEAYMRRENQAVLERTAAAIERDRKNSLKENELDRIAGAAA